MGSDCVNFFIIIYLFFFLKLQGIHLLSIVEESTLILKQFNCYLKSK